MLSTNPMEVSMKIAELPTTTPIENMIASGQIQTSLNGVVVQNGLATTQTNNKAATGEFLKLSQISRKIFEGLFDKNR